MTDTTPSAALDALNFLATIQSDLDDASREANTLASAILRRSDRDFQGYDPNYNPQQDRAALRVLRLAIDGLQTALDARIVKEGLLVTPPTRLAREVSELGDLIGEYVSVHLTPAKPVDIGAAVNANLAALGDAIKEAKN